MRDHRDLEMRRMREQLETVNRRLAMMNLPGKVAEVDPEKRLMRLKIGKTSDGRDIFSPWVRWQEAGAGGLKIHSQPAENEQMVLSSISGTVGAGSLAMPATYDQDHEAPSKSSDTAVFERGKGRIEVGPNGVNIVGPLTHEGVYIGKLHKHSEVRRGGEISGPVAGG